MKILLVAVNAKYIHSNPAVLSLRACAGEYQSCVDVIEFTINQQGSYILQEIYRKQPDVVAFSCYIWNFHLIDSIIFDLHTILPEADIWAGGPEVSYPAEEIIDRWRLRGVMVGPGEGVFRRLVSSYVQNRSADLPMVLDGSRLPRLTLDEIPFYYKDVTDFDHRIIYYESSRGCPFSCSYCLSSIEKTMDFASVDRVCRELDFFLEKKVPQVKFVDRTFNCKKDHALPILEHIFKYDNGVTNFHFEIAADLLDDDYFCLFEKLRPGAVQLEIGVQSTNERTLHEIRRTMDFEKAAAAVRRIVKLGRIHVHLDLIAGLPYEDLRSFAGSFNDVYDLRPEQLQLGFLKVLKGSEMEKKAPEYEIRHTALPPYEVLSTKWLSYQDICHLKQIEEVLEIYYNSSQFHDSLEYLNLFFETPYKMYEFIAAWYEEHKLFGIQLSRVQKYEELMKCGEMRISQWIRDHDSAAAGVGADGHPADDPIAVWKEHLACDLYLRENMKNRPAFCLSMERWKDQIHEILHEEAERHALFPVLSDRNYRELTKALHVEVLEHLFREPAALVFCYEERDPLTNNGKARLVIMRQEKP